MKKILVTGGEGFIGSNIVKVLMDHGHKVTVFDNNSRKNIRLIKNKNYVSFFGDIRDKSKLLEAFNDIEIVFHLAFINGTEFFYNKPELVLDVGIKGMINVIDCIKEKNIKELYLASSSEVYQTPHTIPTSENEMMKIPDPYNPRYSYGAGKIISEILSINYCREILNKLIIFRPHNVYGPNMGKEHVIPELIIKAIKAKKNKERNLLIQGDGKQTRSFNYIDDFCNGILLLLNDAEGFNTYNIGSKNEIQIKDLAEMIIKKLDYNLDIQITNEKIGGTKRRCPDISKICKLGYEEKVSLDIGLDHTIDWYIKNFN